MDLPSVPDVQPIFLIGGIRGKFRQHLCAWAQGENFILEGDEYDTAFFDKGPKFLHYFPDAAILTSVEFDHADIYKNLDDSEDGVQATGEPDPASRSAHRVGRSSRTSTSALARAFCQVERYGFGENSNVAHR